MKVNFPMPPALQMLQDLLGGDSSSDDDEVAEKPESGESPLATTSRCVLTSEICDTGG